MYYDQAMAVDDSDKFREAMLKEIAAHFERKHWKLRDIKQIPPTTKLLDRVWAMFPKRRITIGEVYKYKDTWMNMEGSKSKE